MTYFIILALVGFMLYIRFSPVNVAQWHVDPFTVAAPKVGGTLVTTSIAIDDMAALSALAAAAEATDRTVLLAGSVSEGRLTYVTRSKFWGFPDYTTIAADGTKLAIFARLRFGKADLDVNATRVKKWMAVAGL